MFPPLSTSPTSPEEPEVCRERFEDLLNSRLLKLCLLLQGKSLWTRLFTSLFAESLSSKHLKKKDLGFVCPFLFGWADEQMRPTVSARPCGTESRPDRRSTRVCTPGPCATPHPPSPCLHTRLGLQGPCVHTFTVTRTFPRLGDPYPPTPPSLSRMHTPIDLPPVYSHSPVPGKPHSPSRVRGGGSPGPWDQCTHEDWGPTPGGLTVHPLHSLTPGDPDGQGGVSGLNEAN